MAKVEAGQRTWKDFHRPRRVPETVAPRPLPKAKNKTRARATLQAALALGGGVKRRQSKTPVEQLALSPQWTEHIIVKFENHRERFANRITPTLEDPAEVWTTHYDNGEFRRHYIKAWSDGKGTLCVVAETPSGAVLYNFIPARARGINAWRKGELLYRKE